MQTPGKQTPYSDMKDQPKRKVATDLLGHWFRTIRAEQTFRDFHTWGVVTTPEALCRDCGLGLGIRVYGFGV